MPDAIATYIDTTDVLYVQDQHGILLDFIPFYEIFISQINIHGRTGPIILDRVCRSATDQKRLLRSPRIRCHPIISIQTQSPWSDGIINITGYDEFKLEFT